jgi:hypothetical protein
MADKKISALTAATTPLAGTEVLPIVQSGSTVKVAISDVTAGRVVGASSVAVSSLSSPYVRVDNGALGTLNVASLELWTTNNFSGRSKTFIRNECQNAGNSNADLVFGVNSTGGGAEYEAARLKGVGGDLQLAIGNLVIGTAGKGIDFSASGGGFIGSKRGQIASSGGSTTTLVTLDNANENRIYLLTVRQSGGTSNTVIGQVISFGGSSSALRIAQDNTLAALDMNFTTSGLNVQLVIAAGFGSTTWDWVLTRIA